MTSCPDEPTLRRLEAGELPDGEADGVITHVEACGECSAHLDRFRSNGLDGRVLRAALRDESGTATGTATDSVSGPVSASSPDEFEWCIPDYERVRLCGEGAFGTVWAVRDRVGIHRALKIIDLSRLKSANVQCRESTALEAYCRRVRRHTNLIEIMHVGVQGSLLYYTMELADDDRTRKPVREDIPDGYRPLTLHNVISRGPIRPDTAMEVVSRLLRGLSRLHETGLAHRDIKPANIVFVGRQPKLADIGMITTNTATPSSVGTPQYMPPDGRMDLTGDVFSMAMVLHELLSGSSGAVFPQLPPHVHKADSIWDMGEVERVLVVAGAADAAERHGDAGHLLEELESCRLLAFESLFPDLGPVMRNRRRPFDPGLAAIISSTLRVLPWVLGLLLAIILAQKLL
jgi:serine/threonine protein kinase